MQANRSSEADHNGACMKIAELMECSVLERHAQTGQQIRDVALEYGQVSAHTAFIAVDSLSRAEGAHGIGGAVPILVRKGVRYETMVWGRWYFG